MFLPAFFPGSYLSWMIRQGSSYPCTADKILSREKKKESCLKFKRKRILLERQDKEESVQNHKIFDISWTLGMILSSEKKEDSC